MAKYKQHINTRTRVWPVRVGETLTTPTDPPHTHTHYTTPPKLLLSAKLLQCSTCLIAAAKTHKKAQRWALFVCQATTTVPSRKYAHAGVPCSRQRGSCVTQRARCSLSFSQPAFTLRSNTDHIHHAGCCERVSIQMFGQGSKTNRSMFPLSADTWEDHLKSTSHFGDLNNIDVVPRELRGVFIRRRYSILGWDTQ